MRKCAAFALLASVGMGAAAQNPILQKERQVLLDFRIDRKFSDPRIPAGDDVLVPREVGGTCSRAQRGDLVV